jgi:opacity protein-like surface antigen
MRKHLVAMLLVFCGLAMYAVSATAEMYIAGQVGYASPSKLSDIKGTGSITGETLSDLSLKNNIAYGLKIGGYFPGILKWLGVELEGFYNQPDIKAQSATSSSQGPISLETNRLRVAHFAVNVLARYPGTTFQPYIGIGGGANVAGLDENINNKIVDDVAIAPSMNALAGVRIFLTQNIAFFGEYKYSRSTFKFSDNEIEAKYQTNMFMGGISFHFQ